MGNDTSAYINKVFDPNARKALSELLERVAGSTDAYPLYVDEAFTTALTIAADGTTGIAITSAFSGSNAISLAGTGSAAGVNISGNHTVGVTIGAQTTAGVAITGATATGVSITGSCSTAAIQVGVSGTAAGDILAYGATAGCSMRWDASDDKVVFTRTSATATATNLMTAEVLQTLTGASAVNTAEAFRSVLTSNVQVGNWANAILGKIDFSSAGFVTGLAGAVCGELDMAGVTLGNGSYCCFEAELNAPASCAGWGTSVPVAFMTGNAWGAGVAEFRDDGFIFNFTGVGAATSGKIFQANTATAASHALRILIDGVAYYIMLTETGA